MKENGLNSGLSVPEIAARLEAIGDAIMNGPKFRALIAEALALDERAAYLRKKLGRTALAAGTRSAETNEDLAQSEGCQSGPAKQGNALKTGISGTKGRTA